MTYNRCQSKQEYPQIVFVHGCGTTSLVHALAEEHNFKVRMWIKKAYSSITSKIGSEKVSNSSLSIGYAILIRAKLTLIESKNCQKRM